MFKNVFTKRTIPYTQRTQYAHETLIQADMVLRKKEKLNTQNILTEQKALFIPT